MAQDRVNVVVFLGGKKFEGSLEGAIEFLQMAKSQIRRTAPFAREEDESDFLFTPRWVLKKE